MKLLKLEELTLEQKIGQLICARGYRDEDDKAFVIEMIKKALSAEYRVFATAEATI